MSRVGKQPITIPSGVEVKLNNGSIEVKGPKGTLTQEITQGIQVKQESNQITVERENGDRKVRALHGLMRSIINNMVIGVSQGFTRELVITGVGYRAAVKGSAIEFSLGYSHPIVYELPKGISAEVEKKSNIVKLSGHDKALLGLVAAKIRDFRGPEPYKGKGIRYAEETIRRKAGKSAAGAGAQ